MISQFLNSLREQGLRQEDIAEKVGLSRCQISKLCRGAKPSIETIIKFADIFRVSIDEIMGRKDNQEKDKAA